MDLQQEVVWKVRLHRKKLHEIIQTEIGLVFKEVLLDAGVYKCTEEGRKAFRKFVDTVNA